MTTEQIMRVALLARLQLSDADAQRFAKDMGHVLQMANRIAGLNTDDLEPMTHAVAITNVFREDVSKPSFDREAILLNSAGHDEVSFTVPQVVE